MTDHHPCVHAIMELFENEKKMGWTTKLLKHSPQKSSVNSIKYFCKINKGKVQLVSLFPAFFLGVLRPRSCSLCSGLHGSCTNTLTEHEKKMERKTCTIPSLPDQRNLSNSSNLLPYLWSMSNFASSATEVFVYVHWLQELLEWLDHLAFYLDSPAYHVDMSPGRWESKMLVPWTL